MIAPVLPVELAVIGVQGAALNGSGQTRCAWAEESPFGLAGTMPRDLK